MDWAQCFNEAIRFLENDLTQPPDVEAAARIAGCSVFHFQRMFAYVAGMPLSSTSGAEKCRWPQKNCKTAAR